jgi:hypothetical protein
MSSTGPWPGCKSTWPKQQSWALRLLGQVADQHGLNSFHELSASLARFHINIPKQLSWTLRVLGQVADRHSLNSFHELPWSWPGCRADQHGLTSFQELSGPLARLEIIMDWNWSVMNLHCSFDCVVNVMVVTQLTAWRIWAEKEN